MRNIKLSSPQSEKDHSIATFKGQRAFTITDIVRVTAFSRRQVDYLKGEGLLVPFMHSIKASGRNPGSYFRRSEVLKALIFSEMKNRGFSMQQIRKVAGNLKRLSRHFEETQNYLLTDGHSVYVAQNEHQVIDILRHSGQMILIPLLDPLLKLGVIE